MKPRLLIVTEFKFVDSPRVSRIEFWGLETYSAEEWTRARPGSPWRATKHKSTRNSLDEGLRVHGGLILERAILRRNARLRGVAYSNSIAGDASDKIFAHASTIVERWIELGEYRPKRYFPIRNHCYLSCFSLVFPRGIASDGCWGLQLGGLRVCRTCPAEDNHKLCQGRRIRQTGRTSTGLEIPILAERRPVT